MKCTTCNQERPSTFNTGDIIKNVTDPQEDRARLRIVLDVNNMRDALKYYDYHTANGQEVVLSYAPNGSILGKAIAYAPVDRYKKV